MRNKITPQCASCEHYDGLADACRYPRAGCSRTVRRKNANDADKYADPCRKCKFLDLHSQQCTYAGWGCVQWKEGSRD